MATSLQVLINAQTTNKKGGSNPLPPSFVVLAVSVYIDDAAVIASLTIASGFSSQ